MKRLIGFVAAVFFIVTYLDLLQVSDNSIY